LVYENPQNNVYKANQKLECVKEKATKKVDPNQSQPFKYVI